MPADQGLGTHHHQRIPPVEESREQRQRDSRDRIDASRLGAAFDILGELSTQEQNLCFEGLARPNRQPNPPDQVGNQSDDDGQEAENPMIMPYLQRRTDAEGADRVFSDHNQSAQSHFARANRPYSPTAVQEGFRASATSCHPSDRSRTLAIRVFEQNARSAFLRSTAFAWRVCLRAPLAHRLTGHAQSIGLSTVKQRENQPTDCGPPLRLSRILGCRDLRWSSRDAGLLPQ